jgi:signal transduction histidine kinase
MKLVARVTLAIFLLLTFASAAIGYFAISKYQTSQINLVDDSLDSKIKALVATKEDPLTVAQYLAQVSAIPVSVEYVTDTGTVTVLTVLGPNVPTLPPATLLSQAKHVDVNFGKDLRIRVFQMPNAKKLILAASLATINSDVSNLTRDLVLFIICIDIFASFVAFIFFRRDGKLNQVSRLIAEQQRAMQKFLGDASHELRTPLTVIKGYVDLARKTADPSKHENYLEKSSSEILRMESIINDLLFLAEVGESASEERVPVNLSEKLSDHIEVMRALAPLRAISADLPEDIFYQADPKLIDRMIGNIFSNIRRHTPETASVAVSLKVDTEALTLIVEDGGAGLAQYPSSGRSLKRFASQRSSDGGGSGLGLNILNSVVERYHGALQLSPGSLGGLRVKITLPL